MTQEMLAGCSVQREQQGQEKQGSISSSSSPEPAVAGDATAALSPAHQSTGSSGAAASASSFLSKLNSKAAASVSSMQSVLRKTMTRLNEREGVAVCDACHPAVIREMEKATATAGKKEQEQQHNGDEEEDGEEDEVPAVLAKAAKTRK